MLADGQEVYLQEDPNLELPFLIPEHGYSCDTMRGVPVGLEEYLEVAITSGGLITVLHYACACIIPRVHYVLLIILIGLCQLMVTKDSLGCWVPARVTTSNQIESPFSTQASMYCICC